MAEKKDQIHDEDLDVDINDLLSDDDEEELEDQDDPSQDDQDDDDQWEEDNDEDESDDEEDEEDEDEWEDEDQEEEEELIPVSEYKKLQSASTKWTQKLIHRNKIMNMAFDVLNDVAENQEKLVELYESENKEVAEFILEKYYDNMDIEQFSSDYLGKSYKKKESKLSEDEIRKQERDRIAQEQVQEYVDNLFTKVKISSEEKSKLKEEYEDLIEWKKLTKERAKKYFQIAYNEVRKKPTNDNDTKVTKKTAPGKSSSKKWDVDPYVQEWKDFLKKYWVI